MPLHLRPSTSHQPSLTSQPCQSGSHRGHATSQPHIPRRTVDPVSSGETGEEAFWRQALRVLNENPQVVPPNLDVADAVNDLKALDQLRPRAIRLSRLISRLADTDFALGSDVMQTATQGYALLKVVGRAQGLDEVRKDLGTRFAKRRRAPAEEAKAA